MPLWKGGNLDIHRRERESEVAQPCPTLCDPADCSPPGSSVHGILQARTLEWGAISPCPHPHSPRWQSPACTHARASAPAHCSPGTVQSPERPMAREAGGGWRTTSVPDPAPPRRSLARLRCNSGIHSKQVQITIDIVKQMKQLNAGRWPCVWSDTPVSQGIPATSRKHRKLEEAWKDSPAETSERPQPCQHLGFWFNLKNCETTIFSCFMPPRFFFLSFFLPPSGALLQQPRKTNSLTMLPHVASFTVWSYASSFSCILHPLQVGV